MLLARLAFAINQRILELTRNEKEVVQATKTARHELQMLIALKPLVFSTIAQPAENFMLCSDASMMGGATLYSKNQDWHRSQTTPIGNYHFMLTGRDTPFKVKWKAIHSQRWRYSLHVNVLRGQGFSGRYT